jgi:hypothetical protein
VVGAGYPGAPDVRTVAWLVMPGGRIRKNCMLARYQRETLDLEYLTLRRIRQVK